jgi:chemotaxis protein methyltransferase CheR
MQNSFLRNEDFKLFKDLIFNLTGISLASTKKILVENRLASKLRKLNLNSYQDYYQILLDSEEELQEFVDILTTNETSFFREQIHFDFLKTILKDKKTIRIWSAACSSGEEPYSIAMLILDNFPNIELEILATDIITRVLEKSKLGIYTMERADKIPEKYLRKFCLKGKGDREGYFKINKELKDKIQFKSMNLNSEFPRLAKFDIIFLRNVMIYFNLETRNSLIKKLENLLNKNGYLFIGHSETLVNIDSNLKMIKPSIYQKLET